MNCRDRALSYLSSRIRSSKEVENHLMEKGYEPDEIKETLEFLKEYKYIDDEAYIKAFYEYGRKKKKARYRIIKELEAKGIKISIAKDIIEAIDDDENIHDVSDRELALEVALSMANKESKAMDQRLKAKIGRRLSALGYSTDTIYYVLGKIKDYGQQE